MSLVYNFCLDTRPVRVNIDTPSFDNFQTLRLIIPLHFPPFLPAKRFTFFDALQPPVDIAFLAHFAHFPRSERSERLNRPAWMHGFHLGIAQSLDRISPNSFEFSPTSHFMKRQLRYKIERRLSQQIIGDTFQNHTKFISKSGVLRDSRPILSQTCFITACFNNWLLMVLTEIEISFSSYNYHGSLIIYKNIIK